MAGDPEASVVLGFKRLFAESADRSRRGREQIRASLVQQALAVEQQERRQLGWERKVLSTSCERVLEAALDAIDMEREELAAARREVEQERRALRTALERVQQSCLGGVSADFVFGDDDLAARMDAAWRGMTEGAAGRGSDGAHEREGRLGEQRMAAVLAAEERVERQWEQLAVERGSAARQASAEAEWLAKEKAIREAEQAAREEADRAWQAERAAREEADRAWQAERVAREEADRAWQAERVAREEADRAWQAERVAREELAQAKQAGQAAKQAVARAARGDDSDEIADSYAPRSPLAHADDPKAALLRVKISTLKRLMDRR